jgi:hypothetical protein
MDQRANEDASTPTRIRAVTSYPARRAYKPGVLYPPSVPGVKDAIDIHCHGHEGQQDPLTLSQLASVNGMGGLLFKTIGPMSSDYQPMRVVRKVQEDLARWSDETHIEPIKTWGGYGLTNDNRAPSTERLLDQIKQGVVAVWLPIHNHANAYSKVGARKIWIDKSADPKEHTPPMPWDEALRCGEYMLDDKGKLKPLYEDVIRIIVDHNVALFYGHATHPEIYEITNLVNRLGFKRAVIDHPFSPFIDLSVEQMKELAGAGVYMNFTFDELSPLLGVDPQKMYNAIREIGVEQVTLSSDAGEPLFPNSVECIRLIRGYMEAFGLNADELYTVCARNPGLVVGLGN